MKKRCFIAYFCVFQILNLNINPKPIETIQCNNQEYYLVVNREANGKYFLFKIPEKMAHSLNTKDISDIINIYRSTPKNAERFINIYNKRFRKKYNYKANWNNLVLINGMPDHKVKNIPITGVRPGHIVIGIVLIAKQDFRGEIFKNIEDIKYLLVRSIDSGKYDPYSSRYDVGIINRKLPAGYFAVSELPFGQESAGVITIVSKRIVNRKIPASYVGGGETEVSKWVTTYVINLSLFNIDIGHNWENIRYKYSIIHYTDPKIKGKEVKDLPPLMLQY